MMGLKKANGLYISGRYFIHVVEFIRYNKCIVVISMCSNISILYDNGIVCEIMDSDKFYFYRNKKLLFSISICVVNNNILTDFYGKLGDTHNFISCKSII